MYRLCIGLYAYIGDFFEIVEFWYIVLIKLVIGSIPITLIGFNKYYRWLSIKEVYKTYNLKEIVQLYQPLNV